MAVTSFGLMNIIVGIVVENSLQAADAQRRMEQQLEMLRVRSQLDALKSLFEKADEDGSGLLDLDEFVEILQNTDVQATMKELELPYEFAEKMFEYIDQDGSGEITIDEFVDGAMSMTSDVNSREMRTAVFQISLLTNKMGKMETSVNALCAELGISEDNPAIQKHIATSIPASPVSIQLGSSEAWGQSDDEAPEGAQFASPRSPVVVSPPAGPPSAWRKASTDALGGVVMECMEGFPQDDDAEPDSPTGSLRRKRGLTVPTSAFSSPRRGAPVSDSGTDAGRKRGPLRKGGGVNALALGSRSRIADLEASVGTCVRLLLKLSEAAPDAQLDDRPPSH